MELLNLLKKVILWALAAIVAFLGILFMPSASSILFILFAVLIAPIAPIQDFLKSKGFRGWVKPVLLFVIFCVGFAITPTGGAEDVEVTTPEDSVVVASIEEAESLIEAPVEEPPAISVSPSPAVEETASPSPEVENLTLQIDNFVAAYNEAASEPISRLTEFEAQDTESGCYRTEYRLNAYKDSTAMHGFIGTAEIDLVYCRGLFYNSFRAYVTADTYQEARKIIWNIYHTVDPAADDDAFNGEFSEMPDSSIYIYDFKFTYSQKDNRTEIMIALDNVDDCEVFETGKSSGIPEYPELVITTPEPTLTPAQTPTPTPETTPTPTPEAPTYKYVGSVASDKYHSPSCRHAQNIKESNEIWFTSVEDAKAHGYKPCGTCQ